MERFAKRLRETLNRCLGTRGIISPSDPLFRLLLAQLDLEGFEGLPRNWISARITHAQPSDSLIRVDDTQGLKLSEGFRTTALQGLPG